MKRRRLIIAYLLQYGTYEGLTEQGYIYTLHNKRYSIGTKGLRQQN